MQASGIQKAVMMIALQRVSVSPFVPTRIQDREEIIWDFFRQQTRADCRRREQSPRLPTVSPRRCIAKAPNSPSPTRVRSCATATGFAAEFGFGHCVATDVGSDEEIDSAFAQLAQRWDGLTA